MDGFDRPASARLETGLVPQREARNLAHEALANLLAGGRGSRLAALTDWRAKPAVHFGGKFRIIDFTLSNCVNSGIRRGMAVDSLISGGCIVSGSAVRRSVLFSNVRVSDFCSIEDCVILPEVEIGNNVALKRAAVEKFCRLPGGLRVGFDPETDRKRFHVTDRGVTVIVPESLGQRVHHLR